jgi:hypothetical protein
VCVLVFLPFVHADPTEVVDSNPKPPDFLSRPQNVTVAEGKAATFTCRVKGHPSPVVSWDRDGDRIKSDKNYEVSGAEVLTCFVF